MKALTQQNVTEGHTDDFVAAALARAETLCHAVAGHDLGERPLYIVPQSDLPEGFGSGDSCYGYTTPSLDLYLQDHIRNWRGRGPCMVINDLALPEDYLPDELEYPTCVYVLHELAHILDRPALFQDRTGVNPMRLQFEKMVVAKATQRQARVDLPPYFGHEHAFIRIAIHLCHRAERNGVSIAPAVICAGYQYRLSHAARYQEALGDEPQRCIDLPIREIRASTAPRPFLDLWIKDTDD